MADREAFMACIPTKITSTEVPRKNLRRWAGRSLLERAVDVAVQVAEFVVITTDVADAEVADQFHALREEHADRASVLLNIAPHAHKDGLPGHIWANAWDAAEAYHGSHIPLGWYLEPSSPQRMVAECQNAARLFTDPASAAVGMLFSVEAVPAKYNPIKQTHFGVGVANQPGRVHVPRQALSPTYIRNGRFYLARRHTLMEHGMWSGLSYASVTPPAINIDTEADLECLNHVPPPNEGLH